MKSQMKMLDDLAQLAGGAVGLLSHIQKQVRNDVRERIDEKIADLDLVTREEYERLEAVAETALERQKNLEARLEALEKKSNSGKKKG